MCKKMRTLCSFVWIGMLLVLLTGVAWADALVISVTHNVTPEYIEPIVRAFVEKTGIDVDVMTAGGDELITLTVAGQAPDLFLQVSPRDVYPIWEMGGAEDLTAFVERDNYPIHEMPQDVMASIRRYSEGHLFGWPLYYLNHTTVYNKDLFLAYGMEFPHDSMTFEEALDVARRMSRGVDEERTMGYILSGGYIGIQLQRLMETTGVHLFDESGREVTVNSPEWLELLSVLNRHWNEHRSVHSTGPPAWDAWKWWSEGRMAMYRSVSYANWRRFQEFPFEWDIVRDVSMEAADGVIPTSVEQRHFSMSSISRRKEEAWEFLKFLTSEQAQIILTQTTGDMPLRRGEPFEIWIEGLQPMNMGAFVFEAYQIPEDRKPAPEENYMVREVLRPLLWDMANAERPPMEVVELAQTQMQALLNDAWASRDRR